MSTQERINQLASAALRSAPSTGAAPKPVTFMPSYEALRSAEVAAKQVQVPALRIGIALNAFDAAFAPVTPGQGH